MRIMTKINLGLGIKKRVLDSPTANALRTIINPGRLKLPSYNLFLRPDYACKVTVPWLPTKEEDTNYNDLVALLFISLRIAPARILEVGTCRGRTTVALAENHPGVPLISYDIALQAGEYIKDSPFASAIDIRVKDFALDEARLLREPPFDLVFIDASHDYDSVMAHSLLSLRIVSQRGVILWHDYGNVGGFSGALAVPEVLAKLTKDYRIQGIKGTTLAAYFAPECILGSTQHT